LLPQAAPAEVFLDRFAPQLIDGSDAYWADGRVRDEVFEWVAFRGSRMFEKGVVCTDCHSAHSGALVREGDELCLGCHGPEMPVVQHDHHDGAVACVDCHMPTTVFMQRDPRRDHSFSIPDPVLAAELGLPDTCTEGCHIQQSSEWSADALRAWGADTTRPAAARARAVHAHRKGQGTVAQMLALSRDPHPQWRATGVGLLGEYTHTPAVVARLEQAMTDPDPWTRFAAVGALPVGHRGAQVALADATRAVRMQGARALVDSLPPEHGAMAELRAYLVAHQDQPDAVIELAAWQAHHGDEAAVGVLMRASVRWPREPGVARALAVALSQRGQEGAAMQVLEAAVVSRPDVAGLWDALGRSRGGAGDLAGAASALLSAVALEPDNGRTWYNLGLVYQAMHRPQEALEALSQAEARAPHDPDPPWATATLLYGQGRLDEAQAANTRALTREPGHAGARQLDAAMRR
jgi:predicted CXXCH cytochrome family protein